MKLYKKLSILLIIATFSSVLLANDTIFTSLKNTIVFDKANSNVSTPITLSGTLHLVDEAGNSKDTEFDSFTEYSIYLAVYTTDGKYIKNLLEDYRKDINQYSMSSQDVAGLIPGQSYKVEGSITLDHDGKFDKYTINETFVWPNQDTTKDFTLKLESSYQEKGSSHLVGKVFIPLNGQNVLAKNSVVKLLEADGITELYRERVQDGVYRFLCGNPDLYRRVGETFKVSITAFEPSNESFKPYTLTESFVFKEDGMLKDFVLTPSTTYSIPNAITMNGKVTLYNSKGEQVNAYQFTRQSSEFSYSLRIKGDKDPGTLTNHYGIVDVNCNPHIEKDGTITYSVTSEYDLYTETFDLIPGRTYTIEGEIKLRDRNESFLFEDEIVWPSSNTTKDLKFTRK